LGYDAEPSSATATNEITLGSNVASGYTVRYVGNQSQGTQVNAWANAETYTFTCEVNGATQTIAGGISLPNRNTFLVGVEVFLTSNAVVSYNALLSITAVNCQTQISTLTSATCGGAIDSVAYSITGAVAARKLNIALDPGAATNTSSYTVRTALSPGFIAGKVI
jgi:hypothetical protein